MARDHGKRVGSTGGCNGPRGIHWWWKEVESSSEWRQFRPSTAAAMAELDGLWSSLSLLEQSGRLEGGSAEEAGELGDTRDGLK